MVKKIFKKFSRIFNHRYTTEELADKWLTDIYEIIDKAKSENETGVVLSINGREPQIVEIVTVNLEQNNFMVTECYNSLFIRW